MLWVLRAFAAWAGTDNRLGPFWISLGRTIIYILW